MDYKLNLIYPVNSTNASSSGYFNSLDSYQVFLNINPYLL